MIQPLQRLRRQESSNRRIQTGGAGVNIGIWALTAPPGVLLLGGISHLENYVQAFAFIAKTVSGGTKIQQFYIAVFCNINIARRYIPMDKPFGMDRRQRPQHRDHHIKGLFSADGSALIGDIGFKRDSLNIVHDEIGRIVFVKVIRYSGDIGLAHKLRQGPGLL